MMKMLVLVSLIPTALSAFAGGGGCDDCDRPPYQPLFECKLTKIDYFDKTLGEHGKDIKHDIQALWNNGLRARFVGGPGQVNGVELRYDYTGAIVASHGHAFDWQPEMTAFDFPFDIRNPWAQYAKCGEPFLAVTRFHFRKEESWPAPKVRILVEWHEVACDDKASFKAVLLEGELVCRTH